MANRCRIWWPEKLLPLEPPLSSHHAPHNPSILFGWCFNGYGADSLDLVLVSAIPSDRISASFPRFCDLQETLTSINGKMPYRLQHKALFTLVGCCTVSETTFASEKEFNGDATEGCSEFQRSFLQKNGIWVQLLLSGTRSVSFGNDGIRTVPVVRNLHVGPDLLENCDCHVILYEIPTMGKNHYSLIPWGISQEKRSTLKKPSWIKILGEKPPVVDLESVILAVNCSNYAKLSIEEQARITGPVSRSFLVTIYDVVWHCVTLCLASIFTVAYHFIQCSHELLTCNFGKGLFFLGKLIPYSCKTVHVRSCQFLYWPVFLHKHTFSLFPNVEFSHRSSSRNHLWSSISTDLTFGILLSIFFLANTKPISNWILSICHTLTESILRSGCVWLMGVPAGFKLNTKLARVLGMLSLNMIQVYSTIWYFIGTSILGYIIVAFIIVGIVFGATLQLALFLDLVRLVTLHVTSLHWLVSVLYSRQIQALASLWRIFRGRKWNPLRQRLDSYGYTVEQHVVGSLIFSPLLLLLPTTSVFYIFFTMLNTIITLLSISVEVLISLLYVTPCYEIFLWVLNKTRFPSGVWFSNVSLPDEVVVSILHSNHARLGELIGPHYKNVFSGISSSFAKSMAYSMLTGCRITSNLSTSIPAITPWMKLGCKEYWKLCHDSILESTSTQKKRRFC
ncbi:Phosphatidylinositol N-acetylglucosaminyltransferase subunit Q [Rhynchospora pubera]|uniref:Phosphatidylinositol N-acetylglucosaminyltransferase subunit Q n=1 Tax=Rhynchospora pubera TaxID=906938 RepID=A0AAV8CAT8_9POAL|nr:Phosphatidylinositol N-acetylglucosaminyltransferase subunit Q [Rhynchospora pubera]